MPKGSCPPGPAGEELVELPYVRAPPLATPPPVYALTSERGTDLLYLYTGRVCAQRAHADRTVSCIIALGICVAIVEARRYILHNVYKPTVEGALATTAHSPGNCGSRLTPGAHSKPARVNTKLGETLLPNVGTSGRWMKR